MKVFLGLLKAHFPVLILALAIGLLSVGPNFVFSHSKGYEGIPMYGIPDENYYMARNQAAFIGCFWNCNPFVPEAHPPAFSDASLSEPILAIPGILFHFTAVQLGIFYEFFFPFILTLLFYSFIYRLAKNRLIALLGSCIIMCGFDFFGVEFIDITDPFMVWYGHKSLLYSVTSSFLAYSRPVNPALSSVLFLIYANVLLSYFETRKRVWLISSALVSAFAWYIYLYLSTFIVVVNISVLAVKFLQRNFREFVEYGIAMIASMVLALPSILNLFATMHGGPTASSEFITHTHAIAFNYSALFLLVAFVAIVWIYSLKYPRTPHLYFIVTLVLASCLIVEQHVITGLEPQIFHYEWYYNTPIAVFAACFFASKFIQPKFKKVLYVGFILAIIWILVAAALDQYVSYEHWYRYTMSLQKYMPLLQKINEGPQGVIYTSDDWNMRELAPIFTHEYVPNAPSASIYQEI